MYTFLEKRCPIRDTVIYELLLFILYRYSRIISNNYKLLTIYIESHYSACIQINVRPFTITVIIKIICRWSMY